MALVVRRKRPLGRVSGALIYGTTWLRRFLWKMPTLSWITSRAEFTKSNLQSQRWRKAKIFIREQVLMVSTNVTSATEQQNGHILLCHHVHVKDHVGVIRHVLRHLSAGVSQ